MSDKPKRKHSKETIELMKKKRRARTKQPRSGTSKKRQSFYDELKSEYKGNKDILKWLEENKELLGTTQEQADADGIITEYSQSKHSHNVFPIGDVLYAPGEEQEENGEQEIYDDFSDDF